MMRKIEKNKKGLSEMVSYVLLVIIAVSLSILVYAWLKTQLPKEIDQCPDRTSVIIKNIFCDEVDKKINITFQNKGFFDVDGISVKVSKRARDVPTYNLMTEIKSWENHSIVINEVKNFTYFRNPLRPGNEYFLNYSYKEFSPIKKIQVTPFINKKSEGSQEIKQVVCGNSIIMQEINCN